MTQTSRTVAKARLLIDPELMNRRNDRNPMNLCLGQILEEILVDLQQMTNPGVSHRACGVLKARLSDQ